MFKKRKRRPSTIANFNNVEYDELEKLEKSCNVPKKFGIEVIRTEQMARRRKLRTRTLDAIHKSCEGMRNQRADVCENESSRDVTNHIPMKEDTRLTTSHGKIMEAYIEGYLGKRFQNNMNRTELVPAENFELLPRDIRALEDQQKPSDYDPNLCLSSIFEVSLPSRFEDQNIKITGAIRRVIDDSFEQSSDNSVNGQYRYAIGPVGHIQVGTSSDDRILAAFKKNLPRK